MPRSIPTIWKIGPITAPPRIFILTPTSPDKTTVFELLKKIAAVGRASFGMADGLYTVTRDVEQSTARQHFSPRNSWGFSAHKTFVDLPHALKCRFVNAAADYREDEIVVTDDGYYHEPDTSRDHLVRVDGL